MPDPHSEDVRVYLLGRFEMVHGARHLKAAEWNRRKAAQLMQRIALEGRLPKEKAIDFLWPESSLDSGSNNLYRTLYALRKTLNDAFGAGADETIFSFVNGVLFLDNAVWVDATEFEALAGSPAASIAEREQANALYEGVLLPADPYSDWLAHPRETLRRLNRANCLALAAHYEAKGAYTKAIPLLAPLVADDPLDEMIHRELMRLYALSGQPAAALRQYELCAETLAAELGVDPEAETVALVEAIQAKELAPAVRKAERVETERHRHHLPAQSTPFVGREVEVGDVRRLLQAEPAHRLVTLLGPGGIGKTRLALAIGAEELEAYDDGVCFVPLAPIKSAEHIAPTIAANVGLRFFGAEGPEEQLLDFLHSRRMLLLLDNFEHVMEGKTLVAEILRRAPGVQMLITSRERLNLSGEAVYAVGGLPFPAQDDGIDAAAPREVDAYGAIQLFMQHAERARPRMVFGPDEMAAVTRICRLVQGMPLAIVLAAGWLEMLSPAEIADELGQSVDILESEMADLPTRQRSMQAAFDGSWQRLPAGEQDAFMRLSVFRGGFTREVAQEVCGAALLSLRRLVHKSFVTIDEEGRYQIHELLRQYGEACLEAAGIAAEARTVHANHYLAFLHGLEADLKGRRQLDALREIEADFENVRAAWLWALERDDSERVDRSLESLHLFCDMRARYREGIALLQAALAPGVDHPELTRARLLARYSFMHVFIPGVDAPQIQADLEHCLAVARTHDSLADIAYTLFAYGGFRIFFDSEPAGALAMFDECLAAYDRLEDTFYRARVLNYVAWCHAAQSDLQRSFALTRESLELARMAGSRSDMAVALANLTEISLSLGDLQSAYEYGDEAIELCAQIGLPFVGAQVKLILALISFLRGKTGQSRRLVAEGLQRAEEYHYSLTLAYAAALGGVLAGLDGDCARGKRLGKESLEILANNTLGVVLAHWALALAHCREQEVDQAWAALLGALDEAGRMGAEAVMSWLMPVAAYLLAQDGRPERAVSLLGLAAGHPGNIANWETEWPAFVEMEAGLKGKLGAEAYETAWKAGQTLPLAEVVAELQEQAAA